MKYLLPETTLQGGKYRIERVLGQGGFGITYLARNTVLDVDVAIKEFFLKDENERDGCSVTIPNSTKMELFIRQKEKFKKEAKRMFSIKNEHVIGIHDLFDENNTAYYVMDYVDGENLAERLRRTGQPMSEQEVRDILSQVLDALSVIHPQGLYHLDLKPANIMVDQRGLALLIDFGASKQLSAANGLTAPTSSTLAFTPGYAPLEQIEQNITDFGSWTDLYALGATLYKLLTNLTPPSSNELLKSGGRLTFPTPVSAQMQQLICWMMKPNTDERPQSVEAVRQRLSLQVHQPENEDTEVIVKPRPQVNEKAAQPLPVPKSKSTTRKIVIAFIIGLILVGGVYLAKEQIDHYLVNMEQAAREQEECKKRLQSIFMPFSEGLAVFCDSNRKSGFIDKTGKVVIPCQWDWVEPFSEDLAMVMDNHMKSYIDKTGRVVFSCQWAIAGSFSNGLANVMDANRKWGYIDKTGKVVIPIQWNSAGSFSDGLAVVEDTNAKHGYIDKTGKVVISCQWSDADSFSEGLAPVMGANAKWGYIDKTGKVVISYHWNDARSFCEGLAPVQDSNNKYGFIDNTGKVIIPYLWEGAFPFHDGLAAVRDSNGKWGYIDNTGKVVISCQWMAPGFFIDGIAIVSDDLMKPHKIDKTGKIVE